MSERAGPSRWKIVAAFAAIYLIWGSTYLGIRVAIETMPPLLMAGARYATAGALMLAWAGPRAGEPIRAAHWRSAAVIGGLLLVGGNGAVSWSEQRVASGLAALLISTVPLWIVLLQWAGGERPRALVLAGIALGLAGVGLLIGPGRMFAGSRPDPIGALVLLTGAFCWSVGSLRSRTAELPRSPLLAIALEMLCGGVLLMVAGLAIGEGPRVHWAAISPRSLIAFAYLVGFGSLIGFTAYVWLLRVSRPDRVATYAFVNPVVAMLLGWVLGGEAVTPRELGAAAFIVSAVALVTLSPTGAAPARRRGAGT